MQKVPGYFFLISKDKMKELLILLYDFHVQKLHFYHIIIIIFNFTTTGLFHVGIRLMDMIEDKMEPA
jgi:hypothetical protein